MIQVPDKKGQLTLADALDVFDQLADMEDIAFGYSNDGCYARAHIMCRRMMDAGLKPGKAWAFEGGKPLSVEKPDGNIVQWWYHVASAMDVEMPDGNIQELVFDPGLFDGPVTLEEWGGVMGADPDKLEILEFGGVPKGRVGDYSPGESTGENTDEIAKERMELYLGYQATSQRVVFSSQERQQVVQQFISRQYAHDGDAQITETFQQAQRVPSLQGRTWISQALYQQECTNADNNVKERSEFGSHQVTGEFERAVSSFSDAKNLDTVRENRTNFLERAKNKFLEWYL